MSAHFGVRNLKIALALTMEIHEKIQENTRVLTFKRVEVIIDNSVKDFEDLEIILVMLITYVLYACV